MFHHNILTLLLLLLSFLKLTSSSSLLFSSSSLLLIISILRSQSSASELPSHHVFCRTEIGVRLPFNDYALDTCARCYNYMPEASFKPHSKLRYMPFGLLLNPQTNTTIPSNETQLLSHTFISASLIIKWQQCCADAMHCCLESLQYYQSKPKNQFNGLTGLMSEQCPRTWDGWSCWREDAKPQSIQSQPCPKHIYFHTIAPPCRGYATKECNSTGDWYTIDGREWSNYSNCGRDDIYTGRIRYSIVTNLISIIALIPALFIFYFYKQLSSVSRIRLHKHLFISLLLHACVSSLLKWHLLTESHRQGVSEESMASLSATQISSQTESWPFSSIYCMVLSLLQRYFRSTTYLWMFNEALYLHQLIKRAFTQPPLVPLIALAYLLPLVTIITYIIARSLSNPTMHELPIGGSIMQPQKRTLIVANYTNSNGEVFASMIDQFESDANYEIPAAVTTPGVLVNETFFNDVFDVIDDHEDGTHLGETDECWMMPSHHTWHEWIINAPNLAILVVNCIFLVLLLRVLCIKASSRPSFVPPPPSPSATSHSHHFASGVITRQSVMVSLRAAVLLLPLYGLHYLVIVYRPNIEICWLSETYHYLSLTLDGLQGLAVSIIFCFANNEIRYLLHRSFERVHSRQRNTTIYLTEVNQTH